MENGFKEMRELWVNEVKLFDRGEQSAFFCQPMFIKLMYNGRMKQPFFYIYKIPKTTQKDKYSLRLP